jgi:hypothetical protein
MGKRNGQEPPPPRLCLDHDHTTGKVRDALCHGCNVGLGAFADDPKRLRDPAVRSYIAPRGLETPLEVGAKVGSWETS